MNQTRWRKVTRLEQLARAEALRRQNSVAHQIEFQRKEAFRQIANISLLVLYGEPKIDESLTEAWQRCLESTAWRDCRTRHRDFAEYGRDDEGTPFDDLGARYIAEYFRKYFLPNLPGEDEREKLSGVLQEAPPWLLWFMYADWFGHFLGLNLPNLSDMSEYERGNIPFLCLLKGPFALRLRPPGTKDPFFPRQAHPGILVIPMTEDMTPRERRRTFRINRRQIPVPVFNDGRSGRDRYPTSEELHAELERRGLPLFEPRRPRIIERDHGAPDPSS